MGGVCGGVCGGTLALDWVLGILCLLSQSSVGLCCFLVAIEKNTGSCAIKSSRKRHFQEKSSESRNRRQIGEFMRSCGPPPRPPPLLLHLKVLVFILWRLRGRTLSPHYFCVFLPDRGEKQNQCLRMECVVGCWDVSDGCCGCFILYFSHRQFLEQVETSVISVKRQCIHRAEPRGHEATRPRGREAARA